MMSSVNVTVHRGKVVCDTSVIFFVLLHIRDITEGKPLQLEVSGIEYMNDDPAMVDVLYAKVNVKDRSEKSVRQNLMHLVVI